MKAMTDGGTLNQRRQTKINIKKETYKAHAYAVFFLNFFQNREIFKLRAIHEEFFIPILTLTNVLSYSFF